MSISKSSVNPRPKKTICECDVLRQKIFDAIYENPRIKKHALFAMLGITANELDYGLRRLCKLKQVIRIGSSHAIRYAISSEQIMAEAEEQEKDYHRIFRPARNSDFHGVQCSDRFHQMLVNNLGASL